MCERGLLFVAILNEGTCTYLQSANILIVMIKLSLSVYYCSVVGHKANCA